MQLNKSMKLLDDFYETSLASETENGCEYLLSLNKDHFIYGVHFPDNPVTPGVCLIQICVELMEQYKNCRLRLKRINNVKFISVINPLHDGNLRVAISRITETEDGYGFSALAYNENAQFSKLSLEVEILS